MKAIETLTGVDATAFAGALAPYIAAELASRGQSVLQRKAQRLLVHAAQAQPIGTLAPAVTFTRGANYGASTLVAGVAWNAPAIDAADARIATVSGKLGPANQYGYRQNENAWYGAPHNVALSGGGGWAQQFWFDGRQFEVGVATTGYKASVRLLVDGRAHSTQFDAAQDGNAFYLKVDFGTAALRRIAVLLGANTQINGYVIPAANRMWRADDAGPRLVMMGDSWTAGDEIASLRGAMPHRIGEALGIAHVQVSGQSGQGWMQPASGQTLGQRIARGDLIASGQPDLIMLHGSVNDYQANQATLAANYAAGVSAALAQCPEAFVVAASTMRVSSLDPGSARNAAILAALNAIGSDRLLVLDSYDWITPQAGPDGNQAAMIDGATNHPSAAGAGYLAQRFAQAAISFLKARAAL